MDDSVRWPNELLCISAGFSTSPGQPSRRPKQVLLLGFMTPKRFAAGLLVLPVIVLAGCADSPSQPSNGPAVAVVALKAGVSSTCALTETGAIYCWGAAGYTGVADSVPREIPGNLVLEDFAIANGDFGGGLCAVADDGGTYCWGSYAGWDIYQSYGPPATLLQDTLALHGLAAGDGHMCGIAPDGSANCWGGTIVGKRGHGAPFQPVDWANTIVNRVVGGLAFVALGASRLHTCGLTTSGSIFCWGYAPLLGDTLGTFFTSAGDCFWLTGPCAWEPIHVSRLDNVQSLSVGTFQSCAVRQGGAIWCWQTLGTGTGFPTVVPLPEPAAAVTVGHSHACALATSGKAYCWGSAGPWRGTDDLRSSPLEVATNLRFTSLSAGNKHTCGLAGAGVAYCWGLNQGGELGNGTHSPSYMPVRVQF